jgi:esterase
VLHGLLGSSRNWLTAARALAASGRIIVPDLRNHGASAHDPVHSIEAMAEDVVELIGDAVVPAPSLPFTALLGHSMGGKVAMRLACRRSDLVERLVIVDIAPREYPAGSIEIDALRRLDVRGISSRREADALLALSIPDVSTRQFLLTNLVLDGELGPRWAVNLEALAAGLPDMRAQPLRDSDRYLGPTLFVVGGTSGFVRREDHDRIRAHFPAAEIRVLDGVGHNPHVEALGRFVGIVAPFLARSNESDR